jgi:hypothetical protein
MAQKDFYISAGERRAAQLEAERAAAQADLTAFRAQGDYDSAAEAIQRLADIDSASRNLHNLYERYIQSQQPRYAPPENDAERMAKSWDKMSWQDGLDAATHGSKYASNLDFNDPNVRRGYQEVLRRRSRNE